ncbi:MAG: phosphatidate cytidylyltransferase [Bacteroidetes bacterium]|nr:phosphatidate cytidylyltransferase [Bacteroidota bacterium]
MTPQEIKNILLLSGAFLALFTLCELLYHKAKVQVEYTRKLAHIGTGVLTMLFPLFLSSQWSVMILCGSFLVMLSASMKLGLLKSINAVERETLGSLLYPIVVYICFYFYTVYVTITIFYLPILVMALADPAAALIGKKYPYGKFKIGDKNKTISGTIAFMMVSLTVCIILFFCNRNVRFDCGSESELSIIYIVGMSILISTTTAFTELLCTKGWDNFFIPLVALAELIFFFPTHP